ERTNHRALLVGISNFQALGTSLQFASDDARLFRAFLDTQIRPGETNSVVSLLDENATMSQVETALASLSESVTEDSIVWIFFATHGEETGIHLYNSVSAGRVPGLSMQKLADSIASFSSRACQVNVVLDLCHAGMFNLRTGKKLTPAEQKRTAGIE